MKINCIVVDDEPLALEIIEAYIKKVPSLNFLESFSNPLNALDYLKKNKVDLMFLDIQMEDLSGIQLLNVLNNRPMTIFTTAYDKYAVQGYELDVVDYLLKPISFERFIKSIDKVFEKMNSKTVAAPQAQHEHTTAEATSTYCFVKTEHRLQKVNFEDILYIEGMGDYLRIVMKTSKIMILQNFKKMEEMLPENRFCRVHKSYIVALDKIVNIEKGKITIGEANIPISDKYKGKFNEMLEKITLV